MTKHITMILSILLVCSLLMSGCADRKMTEAQQTSTSQPTTSTAQPGGQNDAALIVRDIPTYQAFTKDAVPEEDVEAILAAGVNSPSAMNSQPWHFSVVTDQEVLEQIAGDMGIPAGGKPSGDRTSGGMTPPDGMTPPSGEKGDRGSKPESAPEGAMPPSAPMTSGAKAGITDAPLVIIVSCKEGSELDAGLATQNMSVEAQLLGYGTKIISSPKMALNGEKQAEYKELLEIPEDMSAVCMLLVGVADTEQYDTVTGATERNADGVVTHR